MRLRLRQFPILAVLLSGAACQARRGPDALGPDVRGLGTSGLCTSGIGAPRPAAALRMGPASVRPPVERTDVEGVLASLERDLPAAVRVSDPSTVGASVASPDGAPAAGADEAPGGQSLSQAASDPTASLLSIQLQNQYVSEYHGLADETGDALLFRAAVPFRTGRLKHIARVTAPIVLDSPSDTTGLGDVVLFDLIVFDASWGRWGLGPVIQLPTASEDALGSGKWSAGPAIGFTAQSGKLLWGVFNQNLFSFAGDDGRPDVNVSSIQPIVNYSLPCKWSIGTTEMNFVYDWDREEWAALPLGVRVSKLVKLGKLPLQLTAGYEHDFADDRVGPADTFILTLKFLLPLGGK